MATINSSLAGVRLLTEGGFLLISAQYIMSESRGVPHATVTTIEFAHARGYYSRAAILFLSLSSRCGYYLRAATI